MFDFMLEALRLIEDRIREIEPWRVSLFILATILLGIIIANV